MPCPPSNDRGIVGDCLYDLLGVPERSRAALRGTDPLDPAAEMDVEIHLRALEFPRVTERQPLFGVLLLPAIYNDLLEQTMIITDPIAAGRDAETRHALQETRRQAPEAAIAQRRVGFGTAHPSRIDPQIAESQPDELV